MSNNQTIEQQLNQARFNGGVITFNFENGSKQVQALSKNVFTDERGKQRSDESVVSVLRADLHV